MTPTSKLAFVPVAAQASPVFATRVGYRLSLRATVFSSLPIAAITSPTHHQGLEVYDAAQGNTQIVGISEEVCSPGRDFSLLVELDSEGRMRSNVQVRAAPMALYRWK